MRGSRPVLREPGEYFPPATHPGFVRDYFTRLDHEWMERFLEHRIADKRVRGDPEMADRGGHRERVVDGDEEGAARASASPLLANVYLHYVFDLWAHQWRRRHARGDVIIVRFADDFVVGLRAS